MIVLVNPPFRDRRSTYWQEYEQASYPNPALTIFAGLLHGQGIPHLCVDAKLEGLGPAELPGVIAERLGGQDITLLGLTNSNTTVIGHDLQTAAELKRAFGSAPLVMGGPHVSALPEQTLRSCPELDLVAMHEGSGILLDLHDYLGVQSRITSLDQIGGLVYRGEGGEPLRSPLWRSRRLDTELLGRPRWEDFPRADTYHVFTALGCPFNCAYCFNTTDRRFAVKPVETIIAELKVLAERGGLGDFFFADATFAVNRRHTLQVLGRMMEEGLHAGAGWRCWTRVDVVDDELVGAMKRAGCVEISLGVESGSDEVLKRARKKTNTGQIGRAVATVKRHGIHCNSFIIFGHIGESEAQVRQTIEMLVAQNPDSVRIGLMTPWPGTEIWELARQGKEGLRLTTTDFQRYDKYFGSALQNQNLAFERLERIRIKAFMDLYLKNRRYVDLLRFSWRLRRPIARKLLAMLSRPASG